MNKIFNNIRENSKELFDFIENLKKENSSLLNNKINNCSYILHKRVDYNICNLNILKNTFHNNNKKLDIYNIKEKNIQNTYEITNTYENIELKLKKQYNLIIPAIYMQLNTNEFLLEEKSLKVFFSYFGKVRFTNICNKYFYILYENYISVLFCYITLIDIISNNNLINKINIKFFEDKLSQPFTKLLSFKQGIEPKKILYNFPRKNNIKKFSFSSLNKIKKLNTIISSNKLSSNNTIKININSKIYIPKATKCLDFNNNIYLANYNKLSNYTHNKFFLEYCYYVNHLNFNYNGVLFCEIFTINLNLSNKNMYLNNVEVNNNINIKIERPKHIATYLIQIENSKEFKVSKKIMGYNGINLKSIVFKSNKFHKLKIRIRGRGSKFIETLNNSESDEPMQLCVSSIDKNTLIESCLIIEKLLMAIYNMYKQYVIANNLYGIVYIPQEIKMQYQYLT